MSLLFVYFIKNSNTSGLNLVTMSLKFIKSGWKYLLWIKARCIAKGIHVGSKEYGLNLLYVILYFVFAEYHTLVYERSK